MLGQILAGVAITCLGALAAACAGSPAQSVAPTSAATVSPATQSASADVAAISALIGTYGATIPSGVNAAPGKWRLTIDEAGLMFTHPEGHRFNPGAVLGVTATEIVLAPDPQCPVQEGTPTEGRYRWRLEGDILRFEVVSDSCQDRADTLTSSDWSLTLPGS